MATSSGIASILERCVLAGAERPAYTDLIEGRDVGRVLSYGDLYRLAGQGASLLRERLQPGERVLLLHDDSLDFMVAFLACIFARVIAVPIPPPDATRLKRTLPRVLAVVADCQASAVLANAGVREQLQQAFAEVAELARLPWLAQEGFVGQAPSSPLAVAPDEVAYLQYSSGSTSMPKGVMMTHANLLDNLRMLQRGFAYDATSISLTWMPYFHDYGLVDGLLQPLYSQAPCYVMSPVAMIKRPWRWLEAVSRFRATHTHGPNFAYQMCVDRITDDKLAALDLSCLRTAGCGAEPVLRETVERFIARFARCGFRPSAFVPAYGLAEGTLMVTAKRPGSHFKTVFLAPENSDSPLCVDLPADDPRARAIISCGVPPDPFDLCIVDPQTAAELPEDTAGEIWLANPSVAAGYWQRPQETADCFAAHTLGGRGPMLRTGDLGFLRDGELYITGRIKDLIIINGLNHYPQDIEQTVEAVGPWVRRTFVVAFAIEQAGEERLVVAAELNGRVGEDGGAAMLDEIRAAISLQHEIACAAIFLLPRGSLAKTSSGKIQRNASKAAYRNGEWAPLVSWHEATVAAATATNALPVLPTTPEPLAVTALETQIRELLARRKGLPAAAIGALDHFANLGISSRLAVEIAAELEDLLARPVAATILWEYPNIRALATCLAAGETAAGVAEKLAASCPTVAVSDEVAIIGMACRLPGAADPEAFWCLLNSGATAIGAPPADRFGQAMADFRGGFIDGVFEFDAGFFGISDGEACQMDPQQRLLLSTAWHALENAGLVAADLAGSDTGVYIGVSASEHAQRNAGEASRFAVSGNSLAIIANRLSYFLDLRGPSLSIDTACSASLVAVHQACRALQAGDCDLALAGGVSVLLDPVAVDSLQQAEMLSPSGVSLPFAAAADGYVRGEGCGVVVLKSLAAARRDGDRILAIIRGSAVAQDGRSNGLTAPNGMAQRQVIAKALARAGVAAESVGYIEAHGTGTPLGDPIEWRALAACYGGAGESPCHVGAVKGVIGHLEAAAGIAGLIKSILVLQHDRIPGAPSLQQVNPQLAGDAGRLHLVRESTAWPASASESLAGPASRLAAVSSFGFGGTLAHVLLAAPDLPVPNATVLKPAESLVAPAEHDQSGAQSAAQLLLLSAADPAALGRLVAACQSWPASAVPALCAGMARYRSHLPWRAAIIATPEQMAQCLADWRESDAVFATAMAAPAEHALPPAGQVENENFLHRLGQLFLSGEFVDWAAVFGPALATRDLPAYPFARTVYRHPAWPQDTGLSLPATYACVWQHQTAQTASRPLAQKVILYSDAQTGVDQALAAACQAAAVEIRPWSAFATGEPGPSAAGDILLVQCMARPDEPVVATALRLAEGLLAGLRALRKQPASGRVWAITRGGAALPQDVSCSPEAACVHGAGRVVALEMPDLWGGLLDLPADLAAVDLAQLLPVIAQAGQEDQIALRQGQCFVARLQTMQLPPATPIRLSAELAYWVVGGSGALGRQVLAALYAAGARQLLVSGRQPMPDQPFEVPGVTYLQADVADPDQVQRVLARLESQGLTLGGIVHAAGNASEYPIEQLNSERFQAVAAAKLAGAWNLHSQTRDCPLQFFVCFASIAGLWGSSGQAHYAAANHFLDMLCEHRRRLGLPGLAIDWGPWAGGGLVDQAVENRLRQAGLDLLSPTSALALFSQLLGSNLARIAAVNVRWPAFLASFTVRRASPLLSELRVGVDQNPNEIPGEIRHAARTDAPTDGQPTIRLSGTVAQVAAEIRRAVEQAVAAQLGRPPDAVRGFFDQGLDSLAMVSMHRQLTAVLGISFPRPDMFSHASVVALSERLLALWQKTAGAMDRHGEEEAGPLPVAAHPQGVRPADGDALSCAEIAAAIEAEMLALGLQDN